MREHHLTRSGRDHLTRQLAGRSPNAKSADAFSNALPRRDSLTPAIEDCLVIALLNHKMREGTKC
jgi:hypothetical protein